MVSSKDVMLVPSAVGFEALSITGDLGSSSKLDPLVHALVANPRWFRGVGDLLYLRTRSGKLVQYGIN